MSHYSAFQLQKAIYTALTNNAVLTALLGDGSDGVVSNPAQCEQLAFPYIVIGDHTARSWNTKSKSGAELTLTIHAFSESGDNEEVCTLLDQVIGTLDKQQLSVSGHYLVLMRWDDFATTLIESTEERVTFHGVVRFRAITTEQ
jgi:hypothetical protein